jgi:hypothetical protein
MHPTKEQMEKYMNCFSVFLLGFLPALIPANIKEKLPSILAPGI